MAADQVPVLVSANARGESGAPGLQSRAVVNVVMEKLLTRRGVDPRYFQLKKQKSGKPYGLLNGHYVGISISHCTSLLVCALHTKGETGIDVEPCGRPLHPRLRERISHPDEHRDLPEELSSIRIWTIKEAALKYLGTGLRHAMSRIRLKRVDEHLFRADPGSGPVTVASFAFRDHWIAVALKQE